MISVPPVHKIVEIRLTQTLPSTPSAIPQLIFPPTPQATSSSEASPSPTPTATSSARTEDISTPSSTVVPRNDQQDDQDELEETQPETVVENQLKNLPEPVANIIRPPLLLFSRLLPGPYYQSFHLPLPYTLIFLGIAAGLVSLGLLLIRL